MIVVDTSALMAIVQREPEGPACQAVLQDAATAMSAGTFAEALTLPAAAGSQAISRSW